MTLDDLAKRLSLSSLMLPNARDEGKQAGFENMMESLANSEALESIARSGVAPTPLILRFFDALGVNDAQIAAWVGISRAGVAQWRSGLNTLSLHIMIYLAWLGSMILKQRAQFIDSPASDALIKAALPKKARFDPAWRERWRNDLRKAQALFEELSAQVATMPPEEVEFAKAKASELMLLKGEEIKAPKKNPAQPDFPLWSLIHELRIPLEELFQVMRGDVSREVIAQWLDGTTLIPLPLACFLTEYCRLAFEDMRRYAELPRLDLEGLLGKPLENDWYEAAKLQFSHIEGLLADQDKFNAAYPDVQALAKEEFAKTKATYAEQWAKSDPRVLLQKFRRKQGEERKAAKTKNQQKRERQRAKR